MEPSVQESPAPQVEESPTYVVEESPTYVVEEEAPTYQVEETAPTAEEMPPVGEPQQVDPAQFDAFVEQLRENLSQVPGFR